MMNLSITSRRHPTSAQMIVFPVFEGAPGLTRQAKRADTSVGGRLKRLLADEKLTGKAGEAAVLHTEGAMAAKKLLLLGVGTAPLTADSARTFAANAVIEARKAKCRTVAVVLPSGLPSKLAPSIIEAMVVGAKLADYRFLGHKGAKAVKDEEDKTVTDFAIELADDPGESGTKALASGVSIADAINNARDWTNLRSNVCTPVYMSNLATWIAMVSKGKIVAHVYGRQDMEGSGLNGVLAVAKGSAQDPKMVRLTYKPRAKTKAKLVLVGKGVTHDAGGYCIKPADSMLEMHMDMAGSAAVFAAMSAIAALDLPVEVHGLVFLAENMISGDAMHNGDVLTMYDGTTVEVGNTDAEGRLGLADLLAYAAKNIPDATCVVDIATLTGACVVALGMKMAGFMSTDDGLAERLVAAGAAGGEKHHRLPLECEYDDLLKSKVADVKNVGGRWGGAITAALFLKRFVGSAPWAHVDIAGPAIPAGTSPTQQQEGASGFGVYTLVNLARSYTK
ncbi:MAG: leucyl aminopeptidase [Patescibacteria group bacterium]|nr:leucyl aminopeptidase [Patescibacteria group bacterium]